MTTEDMGYLVIFGIVSLILGFIAYMTLDNRHHDKDVISWAVAFVLSIIPFLWILKVASFLFMWVFA